MVTVTEREPEWDDEQQNLALALMVLEADKCPGCGHRWSESTTADAVYTVEPLTRCHACTSISIARDNSTAEHPSAVHYFATRVEG